MENEKQIDPESKLFAFLDRLEAEADSNLNKEDSKEVLEEINLLKSLSLDELRDTFQKRNDLLDDPYNKFIRILASLDSLESFTPERAKSLIDSLGPVPNHAISKIKSFCKTIFDSTPSERATQLA